MLRYLLPMFLTEKKRKKSANNFSNKLETPLFATRSSRIGGDIHASEKKKKKKEKERKEKIKKRDEEKEREVKGGKVDDDSSGKELGRERGTGKRRQTEAEAQTETIGSFVLQFRAL